MNIVCRTSRKYPIVSQQDKTREIQARIHLSGDTVSLEGRKCVRVNFYSLDFAGKALCFWSVLVDGVKRVNDSDLCAFLNSIDDTQLQQLKDAFPSVAECVWETNDRKTAALVRLQNTPFLEMKNTDNLIKWLNAETASFKNPFAQHSIENLLGKFWKYLSSEELTKKIYARYLIEYCLCNFKTEQLIAILREIKTENVSDRRFGDAQCDFLLGVHLQNMRLNLYFPERGQSEKEALLEQLANGTGQL